MNVTLRPVREADLASLAGREGEGTRSEFDDFGFRGEGARLRAFAVDGFLPESFDKGRLAVVADGELAGSVSWHQVHYGPNEGSRAFNLGIVLLPSHRGKGVGPRALSLLARYLFDHTTVHRLEGSTDVDNVAMHRAVERAGFVREGVLRGAQFRLGRHHDMVLYSLLRSELTSPA